MRGVRSPVIGDQWPLRGWGVQAGQYRLEAASLGRNDRLAYTVSLASEALQPGVARSVTLPAISPVIFSGPAPSSRNPCAARPGQAPKRPM